MSVCIPLSRDMWDDRMGGQRSKAYSLGVCKTMAMVCCSFLEFGTEFCSWMVQYPSDNWMPARNTDADDQPPGGVAVYIYN